jgi:hypothetical protein
MVVFLMSILNAKKQNKKSWQPSTPILILMAIAKQHLLFTNQFSAASSPT